MRLLLDTHVFIWWDSDPVRLPPETRALLSDPENALVLSVASLWEMQIKQQLGKLHLRLPLADLVSEQQSVNGLCLLAVEARHVYALSSLPLHHKDPFDRLLISQATVEGATLITADEAFAAYGFAPIR